MELPVFSNRHNVNFDFDKSVSFSFFLNRFFNF